MQIGDFEPSELLSSIESLMDGVPLEDASNTLALILNQFTSTAPDPPSAVERLAAEIDPEIAERVAKSDQLADLCRQLARVHPKLADQMEGVRRFL